MDVDVRVFTELLDKFLCLIKRLLEGPRVCPCKKRSVGRRIKVVKGMGECDAEAIVVVAPLQATLTPLPLHRVRLDPVDWLEAHFVELTLLSHSFYCKRARISVLDALDVEVEPCAVVSDVGVGQSITAHVASKMLGICVGLDASREVARVELTGYRDALVHVECILLWMSLIDCYII